MLDYLLQVELTTPRFSVRVSGIDEVIISPKIITDSVLQSEHKDRVYNLKTPKCQDLDCSEFYTSSFTSGKVSQCGNCLPKRTKTTYTKPFGCPQWNFLSRYLFDSTFTKPTRVSNTTTYNEYVTWLTGDPGQSQLKQFLAKSGYWLGLPPCGKGSWQCLVDCAGGEVGGCWDTDSHGSAGFGLVYNINGSNYQVYDPVQILLAGLTPNGGSFPLLSGNPLSGLTANAGNPSDSDYVGCGRPFTILEDARSCLVSQPKPEVCEDEEYQPKEGANSNWEKKAIEGDFGGKSILSQGECYLAPTTSVIQNSYSLAGSLGGNIDVGRFDDPPLFIDQVIENCGACLSKLVEQNDGPSCCQVSYGKIVVRDSPIWDGSSWGPGGFTWNNFWDDSIPDGGFRNDNNCGDPTIPSTCSWSSSCDGPQSGESANGIGTIPCNSGSLKTSCPGELIQVGHYEYYDTCSGEGELVAQYPKFITDCDCSNLPPCYELYRCHLPCAENNPNPYYYSHGASRNKSESECNLSSGQPGCFGFDTLICDAEDRQEKGDYVPVCCSETTSYLSKTPASDGTGEPGSEFAPCQSNLFG